MIKQAEMACDGVFLRVKAVFQQMQTVAGQIHQSFRF